MIIAGVLPLGASIFLLNAAVCERTWTGSFLVFVLNHRASVQIISSIAAGILAAFNVYTATRLLQFAIRIRLLQKTVSVTNLKLFGAICSRSIPFSLPFPMIIVTILLVILCTFPYLLWVGALTPVVSRTTMEGHNLIKIPKSPQTADFYGIRRRS